MAAATRAALGPAFRRMLDAWLACIRGGGKILFFGNGGSAGDAQHLATELTIRYAKDRAPIAAIALTTDTSAITAAGNDMGFERSLPARSRLSAARATSPSASPPPAAAPM